jgi:MarC family integral membrane protein
VSDAIAVFLLTVSALFPIVDPLAGSPLFLSMTQGYAPQTRRVLAWRVALNSLVIMVGSYFVGAHVLNFFGVSLPVVQIGGGLVVASMGWSILLEKDEAHETARRSVTCFEHGTRFPTFHSHCQHHTELCLAAQHPCICFGRPFEGIGFDHGAHSAEYAELQSVL